MGAVIRDPISGALAGVIRSYGKGAMWEQSELGEVPPFLYCGDLFFLGFPASFATSPVL